MISGSRESQTVTSTSLPFRRSSSSSITARLARCSLLIGGQGPVVLIVVRVFGWIFAQPSAIFYPIANPQGVWTGF